MLVWVSSDSHQINHSISNCHSKSSHRIRDIQNVTVIHVEDKVAFRDDSLYRGAQVILSDLARDEVLHGVSTSAEVTVEYKRARSHVDSSLERCESHPIESRGDGVDSALRENKFDVRNGGQNVSLSEAF